ncbi:tryptophan 7-halogenase [Microbacteriaceae bacterium K1510]|nr:tryptophan 7-halogenase [Microbacteriaceae bacterium K1510]
MKRIVVVGAGMAGMACARSLQRRGLRPLLIAPRQAAHNRGETLSFRARPFLEALGWLPLLDAATALACEGRYSIWGSDTLRRDDTQSEAESGWHIDRRKLESRMAATLDADGVERVSGTVRALTRTPHGVSIDLADGSRHEAEIVIDCSGRASISAGDASLTRVDKLVACYAIVALDDDAEAAAATLVEAVADGWWYMSALPGRRILVGFFTDSDLLSSGLRKEPERWAQMASETIAVSQRVESLGIDLSQATLEFAAASTVTATRILEPRIIRAGDAASALDPLAANGLATALWSGTQVADAVAELTAGNGAVAARYEQTFLQGIAAHLAAQRSLYAAERRFRTLPFWQRRNGAEQNSA